MRHLPDAEQVNILAPLVFTYFRNNFREMPTLSANAAQIMAIAPRIADMPIAELETLLRRDPAASAEVVRRANSALYRSHHDIASLNEAVIRLGRLEVHHIMTALATRSLYEPGLRDMVRLLPHHWGRLQRHAVICAFGAGWLAKRLHVGDPELLFLHGMFHDVGKLVALFALAGIILKDQIDFTISFAASAQVMEQAHVDLGCEMLIQSRMPAHVVEACAEHHDEPTAGAPPDRPLHALRVVSCLDTLRENAFVPPATDHELRLSIKVLGLHDVQLRDTAQQLTVITDETASLIAPDLG